MKQSGYTNMSNENDSSVSLFNRKPKNTSYGLTLPDGEKGKDGPIPIRVECIYIPVVGDVDIKSNTFQLKVDVDLSWEATDEDQREFEKNPTGYIPSFVPNLVFSNSSSVDTDEIIPEHGNIIYQMRERKRIYIRHRFIGTLTNKYDVQNFPFDVQNLALIITLSYYDRSKAYFEFPENKSYAYVPLRYMSIPDFDMIRVVTGEIYPDNFSTIVTIIQAKRNRGPFFFRIFLPLLSINAATFVVYELEDTAERVNVLITAMLSFVGMIYILSTLVPMAGKGTLFDMYTMASIMLCVMALLLNTYIFKETALAIHVGLAVAVHLVFLVSSILCLKDANRKTNMSFKELAKAFDVFQPMTYPKIEDAPSPNEPKMD